MEPQVHGHRQRLRDRFLKHGLRGFADYEVVELLLTLAIPRGDVKSTAKALIAKFKSLRGILDAPLEELEGIQGVGKVTPVALRIIREPATLYLQQRAEGQDVFSDPVALEAFYLEVDTKRPKKLTAQVTLTDFVIPNTELIPEDVRSKVRKWSDYIDYWAVDWDFRHDTFMQGWVAYRTRQDRSLPLATDPHTNDKPGKYRVLIKVIDIFGNDTSQVHAVQVR